MFHSGDQNEAMCEKFLMELEELPVDPTLGSASGALHAALLAFLSGEARLHVAACADCRNSLADLVETREALRRVPLAIVEPGPFFVPRVMALIAARQNERNAGEGVWASVRGLAPRMVAFSVVLLVLAGTWAFALQREDAMRRADARSPEAIFDSLTIAPPNDDVLVSPTGSRP
jgi:hypothetical protein